MPAIRILVIASWEVPTAELRASLERADLHAKMTRVDIEPALHAALQRGPFEVALYVRPLSGLPLAMIEPVLADKKLRLVVVDRGEDVGTALVRCLRP